MLIINNEWGKWCIFDGRYPLLVNMEDKDTIARRHFMFAESFLQLVENVFVEIVDSGNANVYIGPPRNNISEHFRQKTKWSDFRILIPTLFNLFHGIELLMKAANYKVVAPPKKPDHKLSAIFCDFKMNYPDSTKLIGILNRYVYPIENDTLILKMFYLDNKIPDSSKFYEIYRYPFKRDFQEDFNYKALSNFGKEGVIFFKQAIEDIQTIMVEIKEM